MEEPKQELCDICESIDFEKVGFRHKFETAPNSLRRPIWEFLNKSSIFCKKIAECYYEWKQEIFGNEAVDLEDEETCEHSNYVHVWVDFSPVGRMIVEFKVTVPFRISDDNKHLLEGPVDEQGYYERNMYLALEFHKCLSECPQAVEDFCKIEPASDWGPIATDIYSGRIRPLCADSRLFRKWKETCCATHGNRCDVNATFGRTLPSLRLIDVEKMCVVECRLRRYTVGSEIDISYVALSYVWGKQSKDESIKQSQLRLSTKDKFIDKEGSLRGEEIPLTIKDALEVTKGLGMRYIWVDSLCIIQDDAADQQKYIPQMDSIYGLAAITIIAASGNDSNSGLPGIRPDSRTREQKPFTIKGVTLLQTLGPASTSSKYIGIRPGYLAESEWNRRGWTLQEKIFSRRALIFTKEQVYWECRIATWCEDSIWEIRELLEVRRPPQSLSGYFSRPWPQEETYFESLYRELVEEYAKRVLTYERDGLDAFAGILNAFETDAHQPFWWALPINFLSNALSWHFESGCLRKRRMDKCIVSVKEATASSDKMIIGCSFPSWSWIGWVGNLRFTDQQSQYIDSRLDAKTVDLIFFYLDGSGSPKKVEATGPTRRLSKIHLREDADKKDVTLEDIQNRVGRLMDIDGAILNILFFWSSTAKLQAQRQDGTSPSLYQNCIDLSGVIMWYQEPSFCDGPTLQFECVVIGRRDWRETAFIYDDLGDGQQAGEGEEGEAAEGEDNEVETVECLVVLLLTPPDRHGVQYREGLVLIKPYWWWLKLKREWKLISLG